MSRSSSPLGAATVVKLGGSVITRKGRDERVRQKVLARLCRELAAAGGPLIVLHGAGSFGHPGAQRYRLAQAPEPGSDPDRRARGAALVAGEVRRLHLAVLRELLGAGASAESVPISTHARNSAGQLAALDASPFRVALDNGHVPVSFGDVVPDEEWGYSILSADTIAARLAAELPVHRVLFVSDVPGVLESDRRSVVTDLSPSLVDRLGVRTSGPDVTGGIRGKVVAMLAIADGGVDAGLITGLSDGTLLRALRGERVHGSWAIAPPR